MTNPEGGMGVMDPPNRRPTTGEEQVRIEAGNLLTPEEGSKLLSLIGEPITLDQVDVFRTHNEIVIENNGNYEEMAQEFFNNLGKYQERSPSLWFEIPLSTEIVNLPSDIPGDLGVKFLEKIGTPIRRSIMGNLGLEKSVSRVVQYLVGEAVSNVGKHTVIDQEKLGSIIIKVAKNKNNIDIVLINPCSSSTNLSIKSNDSFDEYNNKEHGLQVVSGFIDSLKEIGVDVNMKLHLIKSDLSEEASIGVMQRISITLPEESSENDTLQS